MQLLGRGLEHEVVAEPDGPEGEPAIALLGPVGGLVGQRPVTLTPPCAESQLGWVGGWPSPGSAAFVPFSHKQRESAQGVRPDLDEVPGRVAVSEVPGPAAQEQVELLHDHIDRQP
jgi:hypothetical protein